MNASSVFRSTALLSSLSKRHFSKRLWHGAAGTVIPVVAVESPQLVPFKNAPSPFKNASKCHFSTRLRGGDFGSASPVVGVDLTPLATLKNASSPSNDALSAATKLSAATARSGQIQAIIQKIDGLKKSSRKKRRRSYRITDCDWLEPYARHFSVLENRRRELRGTEKKAIIAECTELMPPEVRKYFEENPEWATRFWASKRLEACNGELMRPNRLSKGKQVGDFGSANKQNKAEYSAARRKAHKEEKAELEDELCRIVFDGKEAKEMFRKLLDTPLRELDKNWKGDPTMTVNDIAQLPNSTIHFCFTGQVSVAAEQERFLVNDPNPMFAFPDGRSLTNKDFRRHFDVVQLMELSCDSGIPIRRVEGAFQKHFDERKLGEKCWRWPDNGGNYTDKPGTYKLLFVWSTTVLGEVDAGKMKINPNKGKEGMTKCSEVYTPDSSVCFENYKSLLEPEVLLVSGSIQDAVTLA